LDTTAVLDAASIKWNFYRYSPGLVGGHCIPIDTYYLVYKAKEIGYHPQVILAGRSINDSMPKHVVDLTIKALNDAGVPINGSKILIMGLTSKENVEDTRETPVKEVINGLKEFRCDLYGYDPLLSNDEIAIFGIKSVENLQDIIVDCVLVTVLHDTFKKMTLDNLRGIMKSPPVLIDIRGGFREAESPGFIYRSL